MIQVTFYTYDSHTAHKHVINTGKATIQEAFHVAIQNGCDPRDTILYKEVRSKSPRQLCAQFDRLTAMVDNEANPERFNRICDTFERYVMHLCAHFNLPCDEFSPLESIYEPEVFDEQVLVTDYAF